MLTYYRTIFDIMPRSDEQSVGLKLLNDVEKTLRVWAHQSLGSFPECWMIPATPIQGASGRTVTTTYTSAAAPWITRVIFGCVGIRTTWMTESSNVTWVSA